MTNKLTAVLWSSGGLLLTLFIAWYFSRNNANVAPAGTTYTSAEPSINFGGTTIAPVTVTKGSNSGSGANGSCCQRCADSSSISAGKVLQSGDFTQSVVAATHAAVNSGSISTDVATAGAPQGVMLIAQQNGGMPLPSESWWTGDPLYRQAYVISYNQTVGQLAQILMQQKRPAISQMPMSYANNSSASAAENMASSDGAKQLARGGHDTRWLVEAQNNSRLMMSTMQQTLNQWLSKLGDKNVGGSNFAAPPDQNVSQFLIN